MRNMSSSPRAVLLLTLVAALVAAFTVTARAMVGTASPGAVPRCHTADLSGRFGFIQGAAGSRFGPVLLTNRSGHTCTLRGYIGAQLLGRGERSLHTAVVRDRSEVPRTVRLLRGRSAEATIRWSAVPTANATCPLPRTMKVTPPDETTQLRLRWTSARVCGNGHIDVRPLTLRR
jgi:hypothetical protein